MPNDYLPISINIKIAHILIVGGGKVATHKAQLLNRFTDRAKVVSPVVSDELRQLPFTIIERPFQQCDLAGTDILYVCTGDRELNAQIKNMAQTAGVLASVCDDPELCDFVSPAIARHDRLTIAVGSDATDVKRSIRVRNRIEKLIDEGVLDIS